MAFATLGDNRRAWEIMTMINPVNHAKSSEAVATYKVEPYVVAADIYALAPHIGRGGWTWYTGSAGWMYRLIVESLLGVRREGNKLSFTPCIPDDWDGFNMHYRYGKTIYHIFIIPAQTSESKKMAIVDGVEQSEGIILLVDDGKEHKVEVRL
jgi:cellobiose phosphorylase